MIARVHILLPYPLTVPQQGEFVVYEYDDSGYTIRHLPPSRSEFSDKYNNSEVIVNGEKAINVDVLRVEFVKENFIRAADGPYDPPLDLIRKTANSFLGRLRHVLNASRIKPIDFPFGTSWRLLYLNDDGTEIAREKGGIAGRGMKKEEFTFAALNQEAWKDVHSLAPNFLSPAWKTLLLDAKLILPEIGPAIILTFTALEVFIASVLDATAKSGRTREDLWEWINSRGYLKDPSIEERYSFLSQHLLGVSLKNNNALWAAFLNLRKARNSFAHNGVAKIGDEEVDEQKVRHLITKANEIIEFIRKAVPPELLEPEFKHEINVQLIHKLQ